MEALLNFAIVTAGMTLSLTIGVLMEELIFGKVFCPIFARQAARARSEQRN
jgi:hypothetical protein